MIHKKRREARRGVKSAKKFVEKNEKLFKLHSTASSAVAWKIMTMLIRDELNSSDLDDEEEEKIVIFGDGVDRDEENGVIELGEAELQKIGIKSQVGATDYYDYDEELIKMKRQRQQLLKEIKEDMSNANDYNQATVMMMGISRALDPVLEASKDVINGLSDELQHARSMINNPLSSKKMFQEAGGLKGELFFKNGTSIKTDIFDQQYSEAVKVSFPLGKDLKERSLAYKTHNDQLAMGVVTQFEIKQKMLNQLKIAGIFQNQISKNIPPADMEINFDELSLKNNRVEQFTNPKIENPNYLNMLKGIESLDDSINFDDEISNLIDTGNLDDIIDRLEDVIQNGAQLSDGFVQNYDQKYQKTDGVQGNNPKIVIQYPSGNFSIKDNFKNSRRQDNGSNYDDSDSEESDSPLRRPNGINNDEYSQVYGERGEGEIDRHHNNQNSAKAKNMFNIGDDYRQRNQQGVNKGQLGQKNPNYSPQTADHIGGLGNHLGQNRNIRDDDSLLNKGFPPLIDVDNLSQQELMQQLSQFLIQKLTPENNPPSNPIHNIDPNSQQSFNQKNPNLAQPSSNIPMLVDPESFIADLLSEVGNPSDPQQAKQVKDLQEYLQSMNSENNQLNALIMNPLNAQSGLSNSKNSKFQNVKTPQMGNNTNNNNHDRYMDVLRQAGVNIPSTTMEGDNDNYAGSFKKDVNGNSIMKNNNINPSSGSYDHQNGGQSKPKNSKHNPSSSNYQNQRGSDQNSNSNFNQKPQNMNPAQGYLIDAGSQQNKYGNQIGERSNSGLESQNGPIIDNQRNDNFEQQQYQQQLQQQSNNPKSQNINQLKQNIGDSSQYKNSDTVFAPHQQNNPSGIPYDMRNGSNQKQNLKNRLLNPTLIDPASGQRQGALDGFEGQGESIPSQIHNLINPENSNSLGPNGKVDFSNYSSKDPSKYKSIHGIDSNKENSSIKSNNRASYNPELNHQQQQQQPLYNNFPLSPQQQEQQQGLNQNLLDQRSKSLVDPRRIQHRIDPSLSNQFGIQNNNFNDQLDRRSGLKNPNIGPQKDRDYQYQSNQPKDSNNIQPDNAVSNNIKNLINPQIESNNQNQQRQRNEMKDNKSDGNNISPNLNGNMTIPIKGSNTQRENNGIQNNSSNNPLRTLSNKSEKGNISDDLNRHPNNIILDSFNDKKRNLADNGSYINPNRSVAGDNMDYDKNTGSRDKIN